MIWLLGLNRTATPTHKTAPWLRLSARQFVLAGLFYLSLKLAPAARPLSFLNAWPWRVAHGLGHRIRRLRGLARSPDGAVAWRSCATVARIYCASWRGSRFFFLGRGPRISGQFAQFSRQIPRISRRGPRLLARAHVLCF